MSRSLKERFREVDRVPTPWDTIADGAEEIPGRGSRARGAVVGLLAASLAAAALAVVVVDGELPRRAPDASWLVATVGSCVEQYSTRTLPNREWAFEGTITAVETQADPAGDDPAQTTTVRFEVARWFWGGTADEASLRTYATPSSAGDVERSVGARLLVSGDADFLWACGFTQPFGSRGLQEFQAAERAKA